MSDKDENNWFAIAAGFCLVYATIYFAMWVI